MRCTLIAGATLAATVGLAGMAAAETAAQVDTHAAPTVNGPLIGIEPMADSDATLTYRDGPGVVVIDLGGKMIDCESAGAPSGGSTGTVPSPYHPCR
jgi:hypothetical protein